MKMTFNKHQHFKELPHFISITYEQYRMLQTLLYLTKRRIPFTHILFCKMQTCSLHITLTPGLSLATTSQVMLEDSGNSEKAKLALPSPPFVTELLCW